MVKWLANVPRRCVGVKSQNALHFGPSEARDQSTKFTTIDLAFTIRYVSSPYHVWAMVLISTPECLALLRSKRLSAEPCTFSLGSASLVLILAHLHAYGLPSPHPLLLAHLPNPTFTFTSTGHAWGGRHVLSTSHQVGRVGAAIIEYKDQGLRTSRHPSLPTFVEA